MNIRPAITSDLKVLLEFGYQLHLVEKEFDNLIKYSEAEARDRW